jgi:hypothetical protein
MAEMVEIPDNGGIKLSVKLGTHRGMFWKAWTIGLAYAAIGLCLVLQSSRFERTPSYYNLLVILSAQVWGGIYLVCACTLLGWAIVKPKHEGWAIAAHTLPITLSFCWLAAFIVRYVTDDSTTIVNVVSWSVFFIMLVRSILVVTGEAR